MFKILVVAETSGLDLTVSTLEVCQAASMLAISEGGSWSILVPAHAANVAEMIAPEVLSFQAEESAYYGAEMMSELAAQSVDLVDLVMMAATSTGKDVMARLAQTFSAPLAQDCTGVKVESGEMIFQHPLHGGKVLSDVRLSGNPIFASFRPRSFAPIARSGDSAGVIVQAANNCTPKAQVEFQSRTAREHPDVTEASIVVSGGRGLQGPENWHILEDLLDALGPNAALACSRPVSDEKWRPHNEHVGQTGRAIAPDLYIAVGISGAVQHVAGIARSKCILAINKDPDAPIFQVADYGIIGDLFEVVPALARAIRSSA